MTREYIVVYESAGHSYSAYVPDLPGCVTTGRTLEETKSNMGEAIKGHIAVMREFNESIPEPTTRAETMLITA